MLALSPQVPYLLWARARIRKAQEGRPATDWRMRTPWLAFAASVIISGQDARTRYMGNGFQFLDIVLFAVIAAFFVLRLRNVLGKRTGHEKPPKDPLFGKRAGGEDEKIIPLPDRSEPAGPDEAPDEATEAPEGPVPEGATPGDASPAGLTQIKLADKSFDETEFLGGARGAFEMVIAAFADGDTKSLRPLLSNDVFDDFAGAIAERK